MKPLLCRNVIVGIVRAALPSSLSCLLHLDACQTEVGWSRHGDRQQPCPSPHGVKRAKSRERKPEESSAVRSFTFVKSLRASARPCRRHTWAICSICADLAHMSFPANSRPCLLSATNTSQSSSEQAPVCSSTASSGARTSAAAEGRPSNFLSVATCLISILHNKITTYMLGWLQHFHVKFGVWALCCHQYDSFDVTVQFHWIKVIVTSHMEPMLRFPAGCASLTTRVTQERSLHLWPSFFLEANEHNWLFSPVLLLGGGGMSAVYIAWQTFIYKVF